MSEFKIGDWVRDRDNIYKFVKPSSDWSYQKSLETCILWQPKQGEWCWFWDEYICSLRLGQFLFITPKDEKFKHDMYHFDFPKGTSKLMGINGASYYCEPFIGELPSFLKESICKN